MSEPFFHKLVRGETFVFEARFVGESLGAAVLSVRGSLPSGGFVLTKPSTDTVLMVSPSDDWALGIHNLQLWFSYPSGDLQDEVAIELRVRVEDAP